MTIQSYTTRQRIGLLFSPLLLLILLLCPAPSGMTTGVWHALMITLLMSLLWITEAIPIAVTALLPIVLFPLLGIATVKAAAAPYANPIIFLYLGGFFLALGIQEHGVHRRVALLVLSRVTPTPRGIIAGVMGVTALISMWMSNVATTLMMLPIANSLAGALIDARPSQGESRRFRIGLLLGVAYASSLGGLGTLIGTAPNLLLAGYMMETHGITIRFIDWLFIGMPVVIIGLPLTWLILTRQYISEKEDQTAQLNGYFSSALNDLGPMTHGERVVSLVFLSVALGWLFEPLLSRVFPTMKWNEAGIALIGAIILFSYPIHLKEGRFALSWESARKVPYDILILFGGGISLAQGLQKSGAAAYLASRLFILNGMPVMAVMIVLVIIAIWATEIVSNTALAAMMLPVIGALAGTLGCEPLILLLPVVVGVSCAFMLPVATPPNAIVYATGDVTTEEMAREGVWLNLLFMILIPIVMWSYAVLNGRG